MSDKQLSDIKDESMNYGVSLQKLIGKPIKDVEVYLSREFGDVSVLLYAIVFEDGTRLGCEGEHDAPYLTEYRREPQPNFDDETLERLYEEGQDE